MIKQPTINELKYFVTAVSNLYRVKPKEISPQLVRSSLTLLEALPAAREAVFEYFSIVFDMSVENYVRRLDNDPQAVLPDDESINEIQSTLENLVTKGSTAWSSVISAWCLRLLGKLSDKHSPRRQMDVGAACNLWLGCNSIRCLLGLTALCFRRLNSDDTETCISIMLATFVQHSPHFDWVVARLGSCFPLKVISKILQCGLKGFSGNMNSTLDSEVGILGYLAYSHEKDLKFSLRGMLETSLMSQSGGGPKDDQSNTHTIPYLLHLSRMSDTLLQPIVSVFLDIFDESLVSNLQRQMKFWPSNFNQRDLHGLLTDLAVKTNDNGTKMMIRLARLAGRYPWCHELLEYIFYELEKLYWQVCSCPLLQDVIKNESKQLLWTSCGDSNPIVHSTAVRLILLVTSNRFPLMYHQTICELLTRPSDVNQFALGSLIRILGGPNAAVDIPEIRPGLELALENFFTNDRRKHRDTDQMGFNILRNLVYIVRLERRNICPNLKLMPISKGCVQSIKIILNIFRYLIDRVTKHLDTSLPFTSPTPPSLVSTECEDVEMTDMGTTNKSKRFKSETFEEGQIDDSEPSSSQGVINESLDDEEMLKKQIHYLIALLDCLELAGDPAENISVMDNTDVLRLSKMLVKYFFWNLTERIPMIRLRAMNNVFSMLEKQCQNKTARAAALIDLLDGALFKYCNLFGAEVVAASTFSRMSTRSEDMLISLNQKLGTTTNSNRSILHAGIIGKGPREASKEAKLPDIEIQNFLLKAITACCKDEKHANVVVGFNTVSLLLVEMVSPDVMYNGLPWLEEEFSKVTMERDLQIRRTFKNSPILWTILEHVATFRPALCFTSVLFRALCASVLHQWQAKSVEKTVNLIKSDLMFVTVKLLEIMALGQYIQPPLSYFHFVIDHFDPNEIAIVLKECIWNYMKENVPSPLPFARDATGVQWREPPPRSKNRQKDDILRNMMEKKLPQLGHYYYMMFVLPEAYEAFTIVTTTPAGPESPEPERPTQQQQQPTEI